MIKTFKEYINEGLWKDGVIRASQNKLRKEGIFNTNIDSLIPSNFSFSGGGHYSIGRFAETDIYFPSDRNKEILFTEEDVKIITDHVKNDKWRLPTYDEIKHTLFLNDDLMNYVDFLYTVKRYDKNDYVACIVYLDGTGCSEIRMPFTNSTKLPIEYWLEDGYMEVILENENGELKVLNEEGFETYIEVIIKIHKEHTDTPKRVRLIKTWR